MNRIGHHKHGKKNIVSTRTKGKKKEKEANSKVSPHKTPLVPVGVLSTHTTSAALTDSSPRTSVGQSVINVSADAEQEGQLLDPQSTQTL